MFGYDWCGIVFTNVHEKHVKGCIEAVPEIIKNLRADR